MSEWISVKDRLPERTDAYFAAFSNGGAWIAMFRASDGKWFDDEPLPGEVTHWMPLPKPPIKEPS